MSDRTVVESIYDRLSAGDIEGLVGLVELGGKGRKYHSVHEWIFRDGQPQVWMVYIHEYEIFEACWTAA
jgi:hypothetical protein